MTAEIIRFQQELLLPTLGPGTHKLLGQKSWMGFKGAGISWEDLCAEDAKEFAQWLGPSAFKVVRFSPDIMEIIRRDRPKVVSGGSCMVTTADNKQLRARKMRIEDLIPRLPNLPQLVDPMLPIRGADLHLDILEDTLFAQGRVHLMGPLQAEGCRHTTMFSTWARLHGAAAPVEPCFFSRLPMERATTDFFNGTFFRGQVPEGISRAQVAFSLTGSWADMLRQQRAIPEDSDYLVVEPFHHFTETMKVTTGMPGSPVHEMLRWTQRYFEAYAYGEGLNSGAAGGIAFMPYVQADGRLGWETTATNQTCHQNNTADFLASRRRILEAARIPALSSDELFADGLNCLYLFEDCREALFQIRELWDGVERECEHLRGDKRALKKRKSEIRQSDEIKRAWLAPHGVLYTRLEQLILGVFNPVQINRLAS